MFGFLKRKFDLTKEEQQEEVELFFKGSPSADRIISQILGGSDCDEVINAQGAFGSFDNPIPVNGPRGEYMYLQRIRCRCPNGIMFHRIGSVGGLNDKDSSAKDLFETVCFEGKHWGFFYFDMYHPRRSLKTPAGYSNATWNNMYSRSPYAFGTTHRLDRFPIDLPSYIPKHLGAKYGDALAKKCTEIIGDGLNFVSPLDHAQKRKQYLEQVIEHS